MMKSLVWSGLVKKWNRGYQGLVGVGSGEWGWMGTSPHVGDRYMLAWGRLAPRVQTTWGLWPQEI